MHQILPSVPVVPKPEFKYKNETVLGVIPYIKSQNFFMLERWMIVGTNSAMYVVYFGQDNSSGIFFKKKVQKLEEEYKTKTLEDLLSMGKYFYRVEGMQWPSLKLSNGFFGAGKLQFKDQSKQKITIHLLKKDYETLKNLKTTVAKDMALLPYNQDGELLQKEKYRPIDGVTPLMTEEEQKHSKTKKRLVGIVLIVNSILNLGISAWLFKVGYRDEETINVIIPTIIDFLLGVGLLAKKELMQIVLIRSVLGLLFWGGAFALEKNWMMFLVQAAFLVFVSYTFYSKPTKNSNRISYGLLGILIVLFGLSFWQGFSQGYKDVEQYNKVLKEHAIKVNNKYETQEELLNTDIADYTDVEVKTYYQKLKKAFVDQNESIDGAMKHLENGLKEFKDLESQKNLQGLKSVYDKEILYNAAMIDFINYIESVDLENLSEEQKSIYSQKEEAANKSYNIFLQAARGASVN